ncbi:MAG: antibiotic biosynthesis monooxygenase [Pseudomonadota bacterium]
MAQDGPEAGMILRLFTVQARQDCVEELLAKFATTSAEVVQNEPGNEGYFFGKGVARDDGTVIFASLWKDLDAVKERFGADWQVSFLPPGYEALIDDCSVTHIQLNPGWRMEMEG